LHSFAYFIVSSKTLRLEFLINRIKRGFRRRSPPKADAIHPAAWLCSRVKFIWRRMRGLAGSLLPVLPGWRRIRAEPVRGGARKRCYVQPKSEKRSVKRSLFW